MLAAVVIAFRLLQYWGAMILLGSPLFFIYGLPQQGPLAAKSCRWAKPLLAWSAALLCVAALLGLVAQTGLLAGSFGEGLQPNNLEPAITQMNFGASAVIRGGVAAILLLFLIVLKPSRLLWIMCAGGGTVTCASIAWMGHGAGTEGPAGFIHLLGDMAHALAAAVWIGALVGFVFLLLADDGNGGRDRALHYALRRFSGIGPIAVALIIASGLVNSWFLIGPEKLMGFWTTAYGQVLLAKLLAFATMLALAAINRWRLTPALEDALDAQSRERPLSALKRSLVLEMAAAIAVLALVAWLGTLPPPNSGF